MHAICEGCEARVEPVAPRCESCGAERPDAGWPHVTELRVYTSGEEQEQVVKVPTPRPVERVEAPEVRRADETEAETTMYALTEGDDRAPTEPLPKPKAASRAAGGPPGVLGTYVRLGVSFAATFGLTASVVLGAWFGVLRPEDGIALRPPPQPTVIVREVPVPAPEPVVPVEPVADASDAVADAAEPVVAAPPPKPRRAVRRARPAPPPEPEPEVTEVWTEPEPVAEVAPVPVDPPPVVIPAAAARQAGMYVGKSQGNPVSIELLFLPEDVVEATLRVSERGETATISASGSYTIGDDGVVTISLVENSTAEPRVYSGTVSEGRAIGRVIEGGRARGRFNARR